MYARELQLSADNLIDALLRLDAARRVQILDSGGARMPDARFLIAGFDPFETIEARGLDLHVFGANGHSAGRRESADVLRALDGRLARYHVAYTAGCSAWPATGACIATFSYDLSRFFEKARSRPLSQATTNAAPIEPDALLAFYDTLVIHDYAHSKTQVISVKSAQRLNQVCETINEAASSFDEHAALPTHLLRSTATSNFTRDEYLVAVERIKEHIAAGDIYQANLTQQLSVSLDERLRPETIFLNLRRSHPASFAAFLRRREDAVISASPERFLRVAIEAEGRRTVEAWPIKGTRERGASAAEDARLRAELQHSEKDRAENVMIVDLLRNDLGRVCRYGTVSAPELFTIQEHPTLFHLVSKVRGQLREDVTAGALLRAAFPCGSITGAPKIRAMEIINEIESAPRGLSMGAIGYFSFDRRLDLNVAIRTMVVRRGMARFNVGGGIVADSQPVLEYEESLIKARAPLRALGVREDDFQTAPNA